MVNPGSGLEEACLNIGQSTGSSKFLAKTCELQWESIIKANYKLPNHNWLDICANSPYKSASDWLLQISYGFNSVQIDLEPTKLTDNTATFFLPFSC